MAVSFPRFSLLGIVVVGAFLAISCATSPAKSQQPKSDAPVAQGQAAQQGTQAQAAPVTAQPAFDPSKVTEAQKTATFVDVRAFIDSLNQIIRRQDYKAWLSNLTPEYIAYYSNADVLARYSEYPIIKQKGIKLQTLQDYFINVVFPSRQNDKVDDIEFISEDLIKAITISPKGERNILYLLEKHGDAWKIGIGR